MNENIINEIISLKSAAYCSEAFFRWLEEGENTSSHAANAAAMAYAAPDWSYIETHYDNIMYWLDLKADPEDPENNVLEQEICNNTERYAADIAELYAQYEAYQKEHGSDD